MLSEARSLGIRRPGRESDYSPTFSIEIKNGGTVPHLHVSSWRGAYISIRTTLLCYFSFDLTFSSVSESASSKVSEECLNERATEWVSGWEQALRNDKHCQLPSG
jgi:hypothetical protein